MISYNEDYECLNNYFCKDCILLRDCFKQLAKGSMLNSCVECVEIKGWNDQLVKE